VQGGILGIMVVGFTRAAFSNEAGLGSAAFAHSAVRTRYAASEGMVALLEPFIDTIVVCTMTALVIIVTGTDCQAGSGIQCTSDAFESVLPNFSLILGLAALLFAFSTMLAWSYYGLQAWKYLFGRQLLAENIYKILFCIFIVLGAASSLGAVRRLADSMMLALVIPNMLGLVFLAPLVKEEVQKYLKAIRQES
jgi:AGCS family alanine or glycine:cation symporter